MPGFISELAQVLGWITLALMLAAVLYALFFACREFLHLRSGERKLDAMRAAHYERIDTYADSDGRPATPFSEIDSWRHR